MEEHKPNTIYGTTILTVRKGNDAVIVGDGQVTLGHSVMKSTAEKIKTLSKGKILTGFAGSTADAFALFERLERKLERHPDNLVRACLELAKDWRTDKYLRHLEAMMIVVDKKNTLIISGNGDIIEPEGNVASIGSGGNYALSAAKALYDIEDMNAEEICKKSMKIASELCIYTNYNLTLKKIKSEK
jgi:ATP-dependent HslUV protease subunit HslV